MDHMLRCIKVGDALMNLKILDGLEVRLGTIKG